MNLNGIYIYLHMFTYVYICLNMFIDDSNMVLI